MRRLSRQRLGRVLWSALAIEAVALAAAFALSDPTRLRPDYAGGGLLTLGALAAEFLAIVAFANAHLRQRPEAAWWAAASATAVPAVGVMLLIAGTGGWFVWCGIALLASAAGVLVSLWRGSPPEPGDGGAAGADGATTRRTGRAAVALSAVALVTAISMAVTGPGMEDVDFSGTWTASGRDLTLTLTDGAHGQGGKYTLRSGECTEEATWNLDYPQMTTSVQVWLNQGEATHCLPGGTQVMVRVAGGTVAAPVLSLPGPDGTAWLLTRQ
ncbi:hypothetical protein ACWGDE_08640 [Streptomyces sp. NPDC054956]